MKFPENTTELITKHPQNHSLQFFLVTIFAEGLLAAVWLFLIPGEETISMVRIGMISAALFLSASVGAPWYGLRNGHPLAKKLQASVNRSLERNHTRYFWILVIIFLIAAIFLYKTILTTDPYWKAIFIRIAPLCTLVLLGGLQGIWLLNQLSPGFAEKVQQLQIRANEFSKRTVDQPFLISQKLLNQKVRILDLILILVILGFLFYPRTINQNFVIDDAWITFRYARNLANGFGLTWEPSASPIEGYSNLLEVLILSLGYKLNLDPVLLSQGIGIVSVIGTLAILYWLLRELTGSRVVSFLSLFLFVIHPATYLHVTSGLETSLFIFLTAVIFYLFYQTIRFPAKERFIYLTCAAFLISITRTEGVLIGAFTFGMGWLYGKDRKAWFKYGAIFGGTIVLFQLFRYGYFGGLITGPQIVKLSKKYILGGLSSSEFFHAFFDYLFDTPLGVYAIVAMIFVAAVQLKDFREPKPVQSLLFLAVLMGLGLMAVYSRTNMIQNFANRFLYHTAASQILLTGLGLAYAARMLTNFVNSPARYFASGVLQVGVIFFLATISFNWAVHYPITLEGTKNFTNEYQAQQESARAIATTLNQYDLLDDEWLVTVVDSGILPYFSHAKTLGGDGLTNVELAPLTRNWKENSKAYSTFVFDFNPAILVIERGPNNLTPEFAALVCHPAFKSYTALAKFTRRNKLSYEVYLRSDVASLNEIQQDLLTIEPDFNWVVEPSQTSDPVIQLYQQENCR